MPRPQYGPTEVVSARVPAGWADYIKIAADAQERSVSDLLGDLIYGALLSYGVLNRPPRRPRLPQA
jgi:hypothetical protein